MVENSWMVYCILLTRICSLLHCLPQTSHPLNHNPSLVPRLGFRLRSSARHHRQRALDWSDLLGYSLLHLCVLPSITSSEIFRAVLELTHWVLIDSVSGADSDSALLLQ